MMNFHSLHEQQRATAATTAITAVRRLMRSSAGIAARGLIAIGLAAGSATALAATYKWVDDQGVVHYTDQVPADAVNKGSVVMGKDGGTLRKVDPAPTAEQRRVSAQEAERRKLVARQQEDVLRRDRALAASYTSESEIDLARNRALNTIDAVLQSAGAYSAQLNKRKSELALKMATYKDKPVPNVLERESESLDAELARQADLVSAKRREMATVNARYDADKARWRELSAPKTSIDNAVAVGAPVSAGPKR